MIDIDLQRLYVLLSTILFVLALASAFYLTERPKQDSGSPVMLGAFLLAAVSSLATLVMGVLSLTRISDSERPPHPTTPAFSNGLEFLDNAMRAGIAVTFLALLTGLALLGWRHSRTLGSLSTGAAAIVLVLAVAAFVLTG